MEVKRLLASDGSLAKFDADWAAQCNEVGEDCDSFGIATMSIIRQLAQTEQPKEWAIAIESDSRFMAAACAIRTMQKPYSGWVLRIRELTFCPFIDYGKSDENTYVDILFAVFGGALKLSESTLAAEHIKLHLPSPRDAIFFRAFGNILDNKGGFAATEAHGAWLSLSKS